MNQFIDTKFVFALDQKSITYVSKKVRDPKFKTDMKDALDYWFERDSGEPTLKRAEELRQKIINKISESITKLHETISLKISYDSSLAKLLDEETGEMRHYRWLLKKYQSHLRLFSEVSIYEAQGDWMSIRFLGAKKAI